MDVDDDLDQFDEMIRETVYCLQCRRAKDRHCLAVKMWDWKKREAMLIPIVHQCVECALEDE